MRFLSLNQFSGQLFFIFIFYKPNRRIFSTYFTLLILNDDIITDYIFPVNIQLCVI